MAVGENELTLELGKHFLIIDSNKSFILEDNQGFRAYRPAGAWQIDCWKLLPEQWHKIYPVYALKIVWKNSEDDKDYIPTINATDLDLGDGIAGVSGQPVNITTPVEVANLPNVIVGEQNTVPVHIETNLQPLEVVNHANNIVDGFVLFGRVGYDNVTYSDIKSFFGISEMAVGEKKYIYVKFLQVGGSRKVYNDIAVELVKTGSSIVSFLAMEVGEPPASYGVSEAGSLLFGFGKELD